MWRPDFNSLDDEADTEPPGFWENLVDDPSRLFAQLNLPQPSSFPTFESVSTQARNISSSLYSSWTTLNAILIRHEEALRKRWLKRTRDQRKKILLTAWPDMPAIHRPDFYALTKETPEQRRGTTKFYDHFLYPEINVHDLTEARLLLVFLNSRGRHRPEEFAHADANATHIGRTSGAIRPAFLNQHTMLLSGQSKPEYYGQLMRWEDHDDAFEWMASGFEFQPGMGLLVLERQQKILDFLVKCCHLLLQDMAARSLIDETVPVQPEPPPIVMNETAYQSVAAVAAEAPYRVPAHLDLQRLQSLISARRSAAEDHIWVLREDPSYFAEVVNDVGEHRQETLLDINGRKHPNLKDDVFWERVLGSVVVSAYGNLSLWDTIYKQTADLAALHRKYAGVISPKRRLPEELEKSFHIFRYLVNEASKRPINELKVVVPPSSPIRSSFVRLPQDPESTIIQVTRKPNKGDDILLGFFVMLWDEQQLFLCGLDNIVEVMGRFVQDDPKQKGRFSALVAGIFSDLALLAETLHQINLYQPWASTFEHNAIVDDETIRLKCAKTLSIFTDIAKGLKGVESLGTLGAPLQNKFYYPVEKRRTKQTTDAMRRAEHNLGLFWQKIDQHLECTNSVPEGVRRLLSRDRELQRTPVWIEPVRDRSTDLSKAEPLEDLSLHTPFSKLGINSVEPIRAQELSRLAIKEKIKTRGVPQTDISIHSTEVPLRLIPDEQPKIAVSKRALKVFSAIFFVPSHADQEGEIAWPDFLHAMVSAGFVPEKLYGSVWQFTPTKLDVERSIHFHEPHPAGKIPYYTARRHGRRLNRAYGWTGDTFVLAEHKRED